MSVWLVTGAARGLGAEIAAQALAAGHEVVATARRPQAIADRFPDAGERLLPVALDVTDPATIAGAVAAALDRFGRIDVLVNNAGHGVLGAVEEVSDAAARAVFDTNVFGVLNVQRAVLPVLRRQRGGHVINVASVGGFVAPPGFGVYAATKFAMEGFSEALALEVEPLGIGVTIVEPGSFRTDFLDPSSLAVEEPTVDDYAGTPAGAMRAGSADGNHHQPGDPVAAAAAIVAMADSHAPPLRLPLGSDAADQIRAKLAAVTEELDRWEAIARSTDHAVETTA